MIKRGLSRDCFFIAGQLPIVASFKIAQNSARFSVVGVLANHFKQELIRLIGLASGAGCFGRREQFSRPLAT
jgi:hypothetical protein